MDAGRIYGRGVQFPPGLGADDRVAWSVASENIQQSIRVILSTEPGERLFLPDFGAGLRRFLFEPNTVATRRLIQERIAVSLAQWEPRVRLEGVRVEPDPADARAALATIQYRLVATRTAEQTSVRIQLGA
jgi:phage baseplate assembly protein W